MKLSIDNKNFKTKRNHIYRKEVTQREKGNKKGKENL